MTMTTGIKGGEYTQGLPKNIGYGSQCPERQVLIPWDLESLSIPLHETRSTFGIPIFIDICH